MKLRKNVSISLVDMTNCQWELYFQLSFEQKQFPRRHFLKKLFLKTLQNLQERTCAIKLQAQLLKGYFKKRPRYRSFSWKLFEIFRSTHFQENVLVLQLQIFLIMSLSVSWSWVGISNCLKLLELHILDPFFFHCSLYFFSVSIYPCVVKTLCFGSGNPKDWHNLS